MAQNKLVMEFWDGTRYVQTVSLTKTVLPGVWRYEFSYDSDDYILVLKSGYATWKKALAKSQKQFNELMETFPDLTHHHKIAK